MRGEMTYEFRLSADKKFKQYIYVYYYEKNVVTSLIL